MADRSRDSHILDVLTKRTEILRRLAEGPAHKRDLVDDLDQSRSTINRAIDELAAVDLVRRSDEGFEATIAGRLALDRLGTFRGALEDVVEAEAVLSPLPFDSAVETATVVGGEAVPATDPAPYRPLEQFHGDLGEATGYRALLPALDDPRHVRLLYEHVVTDGRPAELVVAPAVLDTLRTEFPRRMAAMAETEGFRLLVGDVPEFALALVDSGPETDPETAVYVVVFAESGGVHGGLVNETPPAVRWAEKQYAAALDGAKERTDALLAEADGSGAALDDFAPAPGNRLSVALEREGFFELDVSYFREQPVADPKTAWRAGLTVPEVHTGYAVERRAAEEDGSGPRGGSVTETLVEDLRSGTDRIVVGPPGSGKSTVCKRVACEWYAVDEGPVLYREGGRGRPFESVEDLEMTLDTVDGRALVVVEDAVRPDADAVFDAMDSPSDRDDVSFLLDAREGEWRDPPGDPRDVSGLEVLTMPPLDDRDAERIVDHFERTTGETVGASAETLLAEVGDESATADDASAPGEVLLLLHRLSAYADPLAEDRSSLEDDVAAAYGTVADDDLALDVCVLANALNAAGLGVDVAALYAVADPENFEAVDGAIERLEGRVLFPRADGGYRTVHESWSVAFLAHLLEAEGEAIAAERFGDCVTAYLSLADDLARRDRIARHRDGEFSFGQIVDDPGAWADEAVEAVYALARERPKIAPLFYGERDRIALPAACSDEVRHRVPVWIGRALVDAGEFDRAERAFERLPEDGAERVFERRFGLAQVADDRGEFDAAADHAEACLSLAEDLGDPELRGRAERLLGWVLADSDEYDEAEAHLRRALSRFEDRGDRRRTALTLDHLGVVSRCLTEYDSARQYHHRSLELYRELGDRRGVARSRNNLGSVEKNCGDFEAAREHYERALEINRHLGNRSALVSILSNLGLVARHQGEFDAAREYHARSLSISEEIGDRHAEARNLGNLGLIAKSQDDHGEAIDYYERTLEIFRELGLQHGVAKALTNLGEVAVQRGDPENAREYVERGSDVFEEIGDKQGKAINANTLGTAARIEGEYETACEEFRRSIELFGAAGISQGRGVARRDLGETMVEMGRIEEARDHLRTALETFEDVGAPQDALQTLRDLVEACGDAGDEESVERWCERARETLVDAPHVVAEEHREWVERYSGDG